MLSFHDFHKLVEQDMGGGMPPPGGDMGGGMPPPGGPMGGAPPMGGGMPPPGGPMGGPPPGGAAPGGAAPTTELTPADVWTVLEKILAGKPIEDEKKSSGQKEEGDVESQQPPQPPELSQPPTGMPGMPPAPAPGVAGQPQPLLGAPPM